MRDYFILYGEDRKNTHIKKERAYRETKVKRPIHQSSDEQSAFRLGKGVLGLLSPTCAVGCERKNVWRTWNRTSEAKNWERHDTSSQKRGAHGKVDE